MQTRRIPLSITVNARCSVEAVTARPDRSRGWFATLPRTLSVRRLLELPSHHQLSDRREECSVEWLGEYVGGLVLGVDLLGVEDSPILYNVRLEEVVLGGKVLGAWCHCGRLGQGECAIVVFENLGQGGQLELF